MFTHSSPSKVSENIGRVYRSSSIHVVKFIVAWITFVYVWLRSLNKRDPSHEKIYDINKKLSILRFSKFHNWIFFYIYTLGRVSKRIKYTLLHRWFRNQVFLTLCNDNILDLFTQKVMVYKVIHTINRLLCTRNR